MIAYASCVGSPEKFRAYAQPGLRLACEPDSLVAEVTTETSIFSAYNEVLEAFGARDDLEALVLLHEDVEIVDTDFANKIRTRLEEPDIAIVGVVGAREPRGLAWWEYDCYGRCLESRGLVDFGGGAHDVDVVDGVLMALSPWAVRNLRFDEERFTGFHAYDLDLCMQARAAGKRVVVDEIAIMHYPKGGYGDLDRFQASDRTFREKWGLLAARDVAHSQS